MRVDVSEIKQYRNCKRQWEFGSRNRWHITPKVYPSALLFGTLFHECLHALYVGSDYNKILLMIEQELTDPLERKVMLAMIDGYYNNLLPFDLEKYHVKEIEYRWTMDDILPGVELCGSIDMIVIDKQTNEVFGFEHKSAKSFKTPMLIHLDEQPRMYYLALTKLVNRMNSDGETRKYSVGGIYMNEVKKVQRSFDYQRTLCNYQLDDLKNFVRSIIGTCMDISKHTTAGYNETPEPSPVKCQMCMFNTICEHYGYKDMDKEVVLEEFFEEFDVRDVDHLDEKSDRLVE